MLNRSTVILLWIFSTASLYSYGSNFSRIQIIQEDKHRYELNEIMNDDARFKSYSQGKFDRVKKSYWLRFQYSKNDPQKITYLFAPYILYKNLDLYYQIEDSIYHFLTGVSLDFEKRNLFFPNLYLQLPNSKKPVQCWLHVEGFYHYSFFFIEVNNENLVAKEIKDSRREYSLIGLSFLAGIFSLIFYVILRDKLYLYYGLFSLFLIISRLTHSGNIFDYITQYFDITELKSIFNLYAISYGSINLALLFYFYEILKSYQPIKKFHFVIYSLALSRFIFLLIHVNVEDASLERWIDSRIFDLFIQMFLLFCTMRTIKIHFRQGIFAMCSIILLIVGNLIFILTDWGVISLEGVSYDIFLNLAVVEVIVFAMLMAYRTYSLKKENEKAVSKILENLRASELLKDQLNKELEIKVEERTEQIRKMNQLLKSHNIELETKVTIANEARVFQKVMNLEDFTKIFPDDQACYKYLAKVKWKSKEDDKCTKCGYEGYTVIENLARRCGKCGYIESATNGTLFQRLKFPILKAFYITYRTSLGSKDDVTITQMADEIDLRQATLSTFRQKILALMEASKTKKKHKDGWTHLIEYSIKKKDS